MKDYKYRLKNLITGELTSYVGNDNTQTFLGEYGRCDEQGNPIYGWDDNTPDPIEVKNEAIKALNTDYTSYLDGLALSFAKAQMDGNTILMQDLQTERIAVLEQYKIDLQTIQGGE